MNNRRLALLVSLCAVLLGFAVAKRPDVTSAKVLLTQTPSGSTIVPSMTVTPTATATPSCFPRGENSQARVPNLTPTLPPSGTPTITATADPCFVQPELILSGPSQVVVGQVFTLSIQYINLGMPYASIGFNNSSLAQFDPALTMPCKYNEHPTGCSAITIRATNVGTLIINATATGESYNHGWYWGWGSARAPLVVTISDPNATPTVTPSNPCVTPTVTPTPNLGQRQAPQLTQTPSNPCLTPTFTPTPTGTRTATPTFPSYPCYTPTTLPMQQAPQVTQAPCTPTPTMAITPCPTNLVLNASPCVGTPTNTPASGSPTVTPIVKELILSAPNLVNVGDAFSLTIQYVNIGVPYTGITLSPTGTVQFDPPLTMPCKFNEHPTHCRKIGLRAIAPGTIEIDAGATGEVPIAGGGWAWGSAQARNPITVRVLVLDHKTFIPIVKTQ
ncbi:hypothetical protein [Herpetosiphon geysericola]|uniref:DUF11 domain-containing protein n=1 Tax=Herpetosiphon geysericola TaxID=70996 RepID=A0A0P6YV05_9CHLR|nr:hypothetical protein [Herpetosiphon geysericola]KPL88916.1 hypothetical protein SE18_09640 [Herpetosiphon geysericola]